LGVAVRGSEEALGTQQRVEPRLSTAERDELA